MVRSREHSKRAFDLINRVSEYERAEIAAYHYLATGELDNAIDAYQLGIRSYPRIWGFHNELSMTYVDLRRFEDGLKEGLEAGRLLANVEPPYRRQLDAHISLDRTDEAKQLAQKIRALGIDGARIHERFLEIAHLDDDQTAIARETQWFAGKPEEYISLEFQAADRNIHGQRRESHKLYGRPAKAALRQGLLNVAAEFDEVDALADAFSGDCHTAHRLGRPALALALCGDTA
jgi:tetratricopeptide (TPR) repeat protein